MQKLHPRAIWLFFLKLLLRQVFIYLFLGFWLISIFTDRRVRGSFTLAFNSYFWWFFLAFIFLVIGSYIWSRLTYRYWGYQLTEDVFKKEYGVISKKYVSIPYERIQNVDIRRGIMERILGLSVIQIHTAGVGGIAMGEGYLPGLDKRIAEQLREELIQKAKGTKQGL